MKEKSQNEELQSRREFFKEAAKKALPVIGVMALANLPIIAKAAEKEPMGCQYGCAGTCNSSCAGTCTTGCYTSCYGGCRTNCESCRGGCRGTCSGACTGGSHF